MPNVAFQPAKSVTWTGAIEVASWRKYRESGPTLAPHFSTEEPSRPAAVGGLIGVGIRGEKAADPAPTMTTCNRDPP